MKDEIIIDGVVYVKKSLAAMGGESMFIKAVIPKYFIRSSHLNLSLVQSEMFKVMPVTKFKPGMTVKIIIEKE